MNQGVIANTFLIIVAGKALCLCPKRVVLITTTDCIHTG